MKKKLSVILLVLFIAIQLLPVQVKAATASKELKISSELTQWILDKPTNTLYAISEIGKKLIFINATTMSIEKTLTLNGRPTDIIKDNGKLYIALFDLKQIVIVDMASKSITGTLYTSSDPYRIAKDGDKIYYVERQQWCDIYEYNLIAKEDKKLTLGNAPVHEPDLAINTKDHILYIGESGSSSSNMIYYSTNENKVIGKTNYDVGYGFSYPRRYTIFDGTKVYYAGRDFKLDDPTIFNGDFGDVEDVVHESVIYVNKGLVYTNKSIYDKDTHIELGEYGSNVDLVQASDNSLYIYSIESGIIKKFSYTSNVIDRSNVISLISGKPKAPISNTEESIKINSGVSILQMESKLIQWVLNENANTLYGISKADKALFFINAQTLNLEKLLTFASNPTDIIEDDGNLYIALDDARQIVIVDTVSKAIIGILHTSSDPYRIVKDGDKIYYTERDQICDVYEYNLMTNKDEKIPVNNLSKPDLAINTNDHILYIGESGVTYPKMTYYSTTSNQVIGKTNNDEGDILPGPGRYTLFDGEKVYYAGFSFDKQIPTHILGNYGNEDIIFAKYGGAYTKTSVYDSESYSLVGSNGGTFSLIEILNDSVVFYYSEADNLIMRIEPSKISSVQFNSQGGSKVYNAAVDKNTLVSAPTPPIRLGYKFDGWYKEAECINPWNFTTDKVSHDTTLYAKWTYITPTKANGWNYLDGEWYFFNNGTMLGDTWKQDSSKRWFYLGNDGAMFKNSWIQDFSGHWYYLGSDGAMVANTWKQDLLKHWFYLSADGSMISNTWLLYNGKWYFLKANGEMATGWIFSSGCWYYLYPSGEMASNTTINGYRINKNGVWIK